MAKILILIVSIYLSGIVLAFASGAHWAFYLYQVIYFLNPMNHWWSSSLPMVSYSKITVIILFATYFIHRKDLIQNELSKNPQFKWMFILVSIYAITIIFALDFNLHKDATVDFIKLFIVMSVAYKVIDTILKLEWSLLVYILGCAFIGYETILTGRNSQGRVEGVGFIDAPEANGTAAALVASFPLIIYFLWWGNKKIKVLMVICGPLILNGIILINSRGAFLGVATGILYFMFTMIFSKVKSKRQKILAVFFIVLGVSGILTLVDESFVDRISTLTEVKDESASGSHRYRMWLAAIDVAMDNPLGVGAYGFNLLSRYYVPSELFGKKQSYKSVHSTWFQALSEVGWIGLFVFLILIFSTIKTIKKVKKMCGSESLRIYYFAIALQASFLGTLVANTFINQFRTQLMYWCILFISCLYNIVVNKKLKSEVGVNDEIEEKSEKNSQ